MHKPIFHGKLLVHSQVTLVKAIRVVNKCNNENNNYNQKRTKWTRSLALTGQASQSHRVCKSWPLICIDPSLIEDREGLKEDPTYFGGSQSSRQNYEPANNGSRDKFTEQRQYDFIQ
ncbi:hypothetical protein PoB_006515300 [Plakobranchus ocellatus]|uniref:Uncharacterized protein n=1 Tax=Plakobranchus ocellatus TaxID=259542 RepID=A0AAV4D3N3_9GAST|nr:hypothetical protein PoB_006515300 [Plakobranchus ocellatus]